MRIAGWIQAGLHRACEPGCVLRYWGVPVERELYSQPNGTNVMFGALQGTEWIQEAAAT